MRSVGSIAPVPNFFHPYSSSQHFPVFILFVLKEPLWKREIKGHNPKHLSQLNTLVGSLILLWMIFTVVDSFYLLSDIFGRDAKLSVTVANTLPTLAVYPKGGELQF